MSLDAAANVLPAAGHRESEKVLHQQVLQPGPARDVVRLQRWEMNIS